MDKTENKPVINNEMNPVITVNKNKFITNDKKDINSNKIDDSYEINDKQRPVSAETEKNITIKKDINSPVTIKKEDNLGAIKEEQTTVTKEYKKYPIITNEIETPEKSTIIENEWNPVIKKDEWSPVLNKYE